MIEFKQGADLRFSIGDIDKNGDVEMEVKSYDNYSTIYWYIDKTKALEIINHLKEQFKL